MIVTFFRCLAEDAGILQSTWHHVSEEEGMRLQHEEYLHRANNIWYRDMGHSEFLFKHIKTRRIVEGEFHPGRRVIPPENVKYELVYEISNLEDSLSDQDFLEGLIDLCHNFTDMRGKIVLGDVKKEAA
jgi:hypothetical protein